MLACCTRHAAEAYMRVQMVPAEADFVLLEFTFNDAERASAEQSPDDPTRHASLLLGFSTASDCEDAYLM